MSTSRPAKKRALLESHNNATGTTSTASTAYHNTKLDWNAARWKADLEYERERNVRLQKQARHTEERLTTLLKWSEEQVEHYKSVAEDERAQADADLEELRQARDCAVEQLTQLLNERDYDNVQDDDSNNPEDGTNAMVQLWQRKYGMAEAQLKVKDEQLEALQEQLLELQSEKEVEEKSPPGTPSPSPPAVEEGASSPAPSDLLKELNRVRLVLQESEREARQWKRKAEAWKQETETIVPLQETCRAAELRSTHLESSYKTLETNYQTVLAQQEEWETFGRSLQGMLQMDTDQTTISTRAIQKRIQEIQQDLNTSIESNTALEQRVEQLKNWARPAEARMQRFSQQEAAWGQAKLTMEKQLASKQTQIDALKHEHSIYQHEIDNLQQIIASYDQLPSSATGGSATVNALAQAQVDAAQKSLQVELKTTLEQLEAVRQDRDRIQQALDKAQETQTSLQAEIDRIKLKYGQLREALEVAKSATSAANQRAIRAEELAGQGAFNPDTTRVLHLATSNNPLLKTLQQQIASLKRQLQEAKTGGQTGNSSTAMTPGGATTTSRTTPTSGATPATEVNPDKLHQRLKQQFRDQIALFREGVYLITGYKIDMIPPRTASDKTTFRVRSMYGEHEPDQLMLAWPTVPEGQTVRNLDILATDWARLLMTEDSYRYMSQYDSLPAFMASVQLSLFEKQTMMVS